jgi:hypothetical protein
VSTDGKGQAPGTVPASLTAPGCRAGSAANSVAGPVGGLVIQAGTVSARSRYQEALALLPPGHPREPAIQRALDALTDPGKDR